LTKTGLSFFKGLGVEFYSMLNTTSLLISLLLLTSCSFYSSAGRKQFEEKASTTIQAFSEEKASTTAFSLVGCRYLSAAETWLKEEFPNSTHELVELNQDYEVWNKTLKNGHVEVTVLSKSEGSNTESCLYNFESKQAWLTSKKSFLEELSRSLVNID
jgi:hypothetical protein